MGCCKVVCRLLLIALHVIAFRTASADGPRIVSTQIAGVPAVIRIPARTQKPPIILWHGFGPPASEQALMEALPLDDVPAAKVYLGLPLFGKRAPTGGVDDLVRRQQEDVGLRVFEPIVVGAANELPAVVRQLEKQGYMQAGDKIGLFGFSAGGASALLSLAEHKVAIGTVILLNPSTGLSASVQAFERATRQSYEWTVRSRALAARTDAARRAVDIAKGSPLPAVLVLEGDQDDVIVHESVQEFEQVLTPFYTRADEKDRFQHLPVPGLTHNTASPHADDELGRRVADWFNRYL